MAVTGEQQMIAVIDGEIGRRVEIRPATAARLLRGFVDMHLVIRIGQPNRSRQARNPGADDMNCFLHFYLREIR